MAELPAENWIAREGSSPLTEERLASHLYVNARNVWKAASAQLDGCCSAW
jgi:hypothetical protein